MWVGLLLTSCAPIEDTSPSDSWGRTTLRSLSFYENINPEIDLIAAYTRQVGNDFQIRLDFLDLTYLSNFDLYLALDTKPGGTNQLPAVGQADIKWETLLYIPSTGSPQAYSYAQNANANLANNSNSGFVLRNDLIPRVIRIPWQDYLIISINKNLISGTKHRIRLQAFSSLNNAPRKGDEIGPFAFTGSNPAPAPLILAFWNTFPAYTPAQALRRWDGAHTGPFGERHGLSILLENVKRTKVPVVLLDLRNPFSLSAIDALDALPQIAELESQNLVILPDMIPGSPTLPLFPSGLPDWGVRYSLEDTHATTKTFGLHSSQMIYIPRSLEMEFTSYKITFADLNSSKYPAMRGNHILPIPFQIPDEQQAAPDGLSLTARKKLLGNAIRLNAGNTVYPILVLGGSLPESSFGDPQSSQASLDYIANHPWINPLDNQELLTLPRQISPQNLPGVTTLVNTTSFSPNEVLLSLPLPTTRAQNPLYQSAWETAHSLYAPLPPEPQSLPSLRSIYSGQPGIILEAAHWAENPKALNTCTSDPDRDGRDECILASDQFFAIFDLSGGRLISLYYLSGENIHQVVATSSQFIIGLADPSSWLLDAGEGADPDGIHGAFADGEPPWQAYQASFSEDNITLTSPDGLIKKSFRFSPDGLNIDYISQNSVSVQIPLAVDPWSRFFPGWENSYQGTSIPGGYQLNFSNQMEIELLTDAHISASSFTQSPGTYNIPEDPNLDYPAGHYIPFPMVIIELQSPGNFNLNLRVAEK